MSRLSFNKKEGDFDKIDHQHLSNCWWFVKIFDDENGTHKDVLELTKRQMVDRFNGQPLPYRPHIGNVAEIKKLEELDMLRERLDEHHVYDIVWKGKKIGEIRTPF